MDENTVQAMKELIAKQTVCIDTLVDKFNGLLKTVEGCSGTLYEKTADDDRVSKLPPNCNDLSVLQKHMNELNMKLYWTSSSCIDRELNMYALNHWGTVEGRKTWYYMEWTGCGIPEFVYEQLRKYPSYTDTDASSGKTMRLSIGPRGDWDWEQRWNEYEERQEAYLKEKEEHDRWFNSLAPYEQEEYRREQEKKMQKLFEHHRAKNKNNK